MGPFSSVEVLLKNNANPKEQEVTDVLTFFTTGQKTFPEARAAITRLNEFFSPTYHLSDLSVLPTCPIEYQNVLKCAQKKFRTLKFRSQPDSKTISVVY